MNFLKTKNYKLETPHRGFTLVEVLVASGIITVVMIVAIGAIIKIQDANRKAQAVRAIIDNLHGAVENMSRKIRTGTTYRCDRLYPQSDLSIAKDCEPSGPGWSTAFTFLATDDVEAGEGIPTTFRMECVPLTDSGNSETGFPESDGSCRGTQTGTIMYYKANSPSGSYQPLIDPKIDIKSLRFYVHNAAGTVGQPSVLITIYGTINIERVVGTPVPFNIQTTISQYVK